MSNIIHAGRHPNFDITQFSPKSQRALRKLEAVFHLNRDGQIKIGLSSEYKYAFLRPTQVVSNLLHAEKEIVVLFSEYSDYQSRTIDAYDQIYSLHEEHRADKVVRLLVSDDEHVVEKCRVWLSDNPAAPVIIPFFSGELKNSTKIEEVFSRIRTFVYARDLFSLNSPLRSDLYFFGRGQLINEIASKLSSSENFGLFGLRRSGKTSIVFGIQRALNARRLRSVIFDCSSPSIHRKRWFELLAEIVEGFRQEYSSSMKIEYLGRYDEDKASSSFASDMKKISRTNDKGRLVILLDEIERISLGSASSPHWNAGEDFLYFWQSIRAAFQSSSSGFSFLIVGTNPSALEIRTVGNTDNPIWGNVEKRYIPMFSYDQTKEMVTTIGSVMGINFPEAVVGKLQENYGGHPYLTRYACSYIARAAQVRPMEVDKTLYERGCANYNSDADDYIDSMVEFLKNTFEQEFDILKTLASGDNETFSYFAETDPISVDHLKGYGLVEEGHVGYYFRIGIAERYFARRSKPALGMSKEARRTEISERRNKLEISLRRLARLILKANYNDDKALSVVLVALPENRRSNLQGRNAASLLSDEASPLFLKELDQLIQKNWAIFERALSPLEKNDYVYHLKTINIMRSDAHAGDVSSEELEKIRISLHEVGRVVDGFLS